MSHDVLLDNANRQIVEDEYIVAEWSALIGRMRAEGRDLTVACDMLDVFHHNLLARRSSRDRLQQMLAGPMQLLRSP
jgi:hypothetical protein